MQRGRRSRPSSPSTIATSRSPSRTRSRAASRAPSRANSRARSRTRTRSRSVAPKARRASFAAPSRSRSRSRRPSPRRRRSSSASSRPARPSPSPPRRRQSIKDRVRDDAKDAKRDTGLKTSLAFLGAVGAATYVASKYWPKGVIYGEKEDWEKEEVVKHHGKPTRGNGHSRHSPPSRPGYRKSQTAESLGPRSHDKFSKGPHLVTEEIVRRDRDRPVYEEVEVVKRPPPMHSRSEGASMVVNAGARQADTRADARRSGPPRPSHEERPGTGRGQFVAEKDDCCLREVRAVPRTIAEYSMPPKNSASVKGPMPNRVVREEYIVYDNDSRR